MVVFPSQNKLQHHSNDKFLNKTLSRTQREGVKHTKSALHHVAGVVGTRQAVSILQVCPCVFGLEDKLISCQPASQLNIRFTFFPSPLPAEVLECLRAATCCSRVSLVMLSSSSSDRASAISSYWSLSSLLLHHHLSQTGTAPRENGVESTQNGNMIPPCCPVDVKSLRSRAKGEKERKNTKPPAERLVALFDVKQKLASMTDSHYTVPL